MPILSDYTTGTITVAANGVAVTGTGTAWLSAGFQEGDVLYASGFSGIVLSVNSNTSLTLAQPWRGGALNASAYRLRYQPDGSRVSAQARQLIELLGGSGNLQALGGLPGAANKIPRFTGAGTMDLLTLSTFMAGLLDDSDGAAVYASLGEIPNGQLPSRLRESGAQVTAAGALNSINSFGVVSVPTASVATVGGPPGAGGGSCLTLAYDGNSAIQIYSPVVGSDVAWMRSRNAGGAWSTWKRIFTQQSILGTVSIADGVPTGAVVERGTNANGEYTRFADGTQICFRMISQSLVISQLFGNWYYDNLGWTFPAAFTHHWYGLSAMARISGRVVVGAQGDTSATAADCFFVSPVSIPSNLATIRQLAVGRWF